MSKMIRCAKIIEIDMGDGHVKFVNWDNVIDINVCQSQKTDGTSELKVGIEPPDGYVVISITSVNNNTIDYWSSAEIEVIKTSIREQLRIGNMFSM